MKKWFNNLSLSYKFFVIFSILIGIIIFLAIIAIINQYNTQITLNEINNDIQIETLSFHSQVAMFKAQNASQKHLLNFKTTGLAHMRSKYVTEVKNQVETVKKDIATLKTLTSNRDILNLVEQIDEEINLYEATFLNLAEVVEQRGSIDLGLVGAFREKTNRIENFLEDKNLDQLTIDNLTLRRYEKDYLLRSQSTAISQLHDTITEFKQNIAATELDQIQKDELTLLANEYQSNFDQLVDLDTQIEETLSSFEESLEKMGPLLDNIVSVAKDRREDNYNTIVRGNQAQSALTVVLAILAVLVGGGSAFLLTRRIVKEVSKVAQVAKHIAMGRVDDILKVTSSDELGSMATAFNQMIIYQQQITEVANRLAEGDLTVNFVSPSDTDLLGHALEQMIANLRQNAAKTETQFWQATGQAQLNDLTRGQNDITTLAKKVIRHLCQYLNLQIGALYLFENNVLKLVGSYAYTHRKKVSNRFEPGVGLVGQAALEREPLIISDIPNDYIRIGSGLGETAPTQILVSPFMYQNEVVGVIELGSLTPFTQNEINFIEIAMENVAVAFNTTLSRSQIDILLAQSQEQAEELQTQSEELRVLNEELEAQTDSLRESEGRLKEQQVKLEAVNVELEEKAANLEETTLVLQEKQIAIDKQNRELKTAKTTLEEKAKELALASKYKSEFLANMSHELRTPLNSLLILAYLLMENKTGNLSTKEVEQATIIYNSGNDLLNLINEILDLAKIESGKIALEVTEVSLPHLTTALQSQFNAIAQKQGLTWQITLAHDIPPIMETDQQRLEQVLKNFLSNAFKFTEQGEVNLNIYRPDRGVDLSESGLDHKETIAFSVKDSGIGITPQQQKIIFEAFQQADGSTSRKYGGTGLGLSISKQLAVKLGGQIALHSKMGEGSTFTIYLPQALNSEADINKLSTNDHKTSEPLDTYPSPVQVQSTPANTPETSAPRKNKSIMPHPTISDDRDNLNKDEDVVLIIEDDAKFAQILLDLAHEKDLKCLVAPDGKIGLDMVYAYYPTAIVLDLNLPKINGWRVLKVLKKDPKTRHIPIHVVSVEDEKLHALQEGAMGYATKPISQPDLENIFQQIERFKAESIKTLLMVEDDENLRYSMAELLSGRDLQITQANTGQAALDFLAEQTYDCIILDMNLPDMNGLQLLEHLADEDKMVDCPIIVYTGQMLSQEESMDLMKYTDSIIIKSVKSLERLLDETNLFLHRVVEDLQPNKQPSPNKIINAADVLKNKRVLIVDDDLRNSFALSKLLADREIMVEIVQDGQKALDFLAQDSNIDLILMDIMMPVMDGLETIKHIRAQEKFNDLPILALTAKAMKDDREKCLAAGANDYLPKPINPEKLFAMLKIWLYEKAN